MFRFRLQQVLEMREEREKERARELAAAKDVAEAALREQEALAALRDSSRAERDAAPDGLPVGHLHQFGLVIESLEERLQLAHESVREANGAVEDAQGALNEAARERQILDRLKERHTAEWRAEEAQKDRLHMDAVALTRFGSKSSNAGSNTSNPTQ